MSTKVRVQLPKSKHLEYFSRLVSGPETTRTCSEDGCEKPAPEVKGYYLAGNRRVRVWVCKEHRPVGITNQLLPTPPSIIAAFEAERAYCEKKEREYRINRDPERGVSVKTLAQTGHGKRVSNDRVASWRWNGY